MKTLLQCLLLLSCNSFTNAVEILAWKTTIDSIAPRGLEAAGAKRMEKPPEASPFFEPKDEIWDIMSIAMKPDQERSSNPEWVVWNAKSRRIVAKGSWVALSAVEPSFRLLNPVTKCRLKVDAYEVLQKGALPDTSKAPVATLTVDSDISGTDIDASDNAGETSINLESKLSFSVDEPLVDLSLTVQVSSPNGLVVSVQTDAELLAGHRLWLARDFSGDFGMDIFASAYFVLDDSNIMSECTPFAEIIQIQKGNLKIPYLYSALHTNRDFIKIADNKKLLGLNPIPELAESFGAEQENENKDLPAGAPEKSNMIRVPDILAPHFYGYVIDIRPVIEKAGLKIMKDDIVGFDSKNHRAFIYSSDDNIIENFQTLVSPSGELRPRSLSITASGDEELRLVTLSGHRASISRYLHKGKYHRIFSIEPTIKDGVANHDLRFEYEAKEDEKTIRSIESSVTLKNGKPLKIFEKDRDDGAKALLEIKGECLEFK